MKRIAFLKADALMLRRFMALAFSYLLWITAVDGTSA